MSSRQLVPKLCIKIRFFFLYIDAIAKGLGLTRVGWIFTDLVSDSSGQVKHFRNIDSHFLSTQECIMAGYFQNKFANVTKLSSSGKHGSKFVTVCVTGSADRSVHMEGYQVSTQFLDHQQTSLLHLFVVVVSTFKVKYQKISNLRLHMYTGAQLAWV